MEVVGIVVALGREEVVLGTFVPEVGAGLKVGTFEAGLEIDTFVADTLGAGFESDKLGGRFEVGKSEDPSFGVGPFDFLGDIRHNRHREKEPNLSRTEK